MDDGGLCQPRRPGVKFLTVRDGERQVIQAGAGFVERVLAAMPVPGEPQADIPLSLPFVIVMVLLARRIWDTAPER